MKKTPLEKRIVELENAVQHLQNVHMSSYGVPRKLTPSQEVNERLYQLERKVESSDRNVSSLEDRVRAVFRIFGIQHRYGGYFKTNFFRRLFLRTIFDE